MKGTTYIGLLIGLFSALVATAQQPEYKGRMSIVPLQLAQEGDSLYIRIDFDIRGVNVDARRSISLIPILQAAGIEKKLPEVVVKGRINYLTSLREVAVMSKTERRFYEQHRPYTIIKGYKSKGVKRILYQQVIAFEPWMKEAKLNIQQDLCGCGNKPRSLSVSQLVHQVELERIITPYQVAPRLAYVQPEVEVVKKRAVVSEAFLDFVVGKSDIRPDYMNNPKELKKITDMMQEIRSDQAITVHNIQVVGYASPEGGLSLNETLSERRANALVDYLVPRFDYPRSRYHIEFGGENWAGLFERVAQSHMPYKEMVLSILSDQQISDATRKSRLKNFAEGEAYRYMLKTFYPSLRKAVCRIDYQVKPFNVDEARAVVAVRPQNLSLNELYLVANTYQVGSTEFIDLFETAVSMFPQDATANLNAASSALSRKDIVHAERYLNLAKSTPHTAQYNNAMGVLMMLKEDYRAAKEYLDAAANAGLEQAQWNVAEWTKKMENIEAINKQKTK